MIQKLRTFSIILILLIASVSAVSANLVTNGGFDVDTPNAGYQTLSSGLTGWTITNTIDLIGTYWTANSLPNSIDLAGYYTQGSIIQPITTESGKSYTLSFFLAGNPDNGPYPKTVDVFWGGQLVGQFSFDSSGTTKTNMGWVSKSITNLAGQSGSTELKFVDTTGDENNAWGVALDDISVTEQQIPVPEFPSIALPIGLIVGILGAILYIEKSKEN